MAEIDVEGKGPSMWPWIIGLIVLALLIWALAEVLDSEEPEVVGLDETPVVARVRTPDLPRTSGWTRVHGELSAAVVRERSATHRAP